MIVSILGTLLLLAAVGAIGYVLISLFRRVPLEELATSFRQWWLVLLIGLGWGGRIIIGWLRPQD
jgi:hypothetical protein